MLNVRRFIDGAAASKVSALILPLSEPVIPGKAAGRGPESRNQKTRFLQIYLKHSA